MSEQYIRLRVGLRAYGDADPDRVADALAAFLDSDDMRQRLADLEILSVDDVWQVRP